MLGTRGLASLPSPHIDDEIDGATDLDTRLARNCESGSRCAEPDLYLDILTDAVDSAGDIGVEVLVIIVRRIGRGVGAIGCDRRAGCGVRAEGRRARVSVIALRRSSLAARLCLCFCASVAPRVASALLSLRARCVATRSCA